MTQTYVHKLTTPHHGATVSLGEKASFLKRPAKVITLAERRWPAFAKASGTRLRILFPGLPLRVFGDKKDGPNQRLYALIGPTKEVRRNC